MKQLITIVLCLICAFLSANAQTVRLDSSINAQSQQVASTQKKIESSAQRLQFKIDSLKAKGLPTKKYKKQLDSVNQSLKNLFALKTVNQKINQGVSAAKTKITSEKDSLQNKVNGKRKKIETRVNRKKHKIDSVTAKINDPTGNIKTPNVNNDVTKLQNQITNTQLPAGTPSVNLPSGTPNLSLNTANQNTLPNSSSLKLPNESTELNKLSSNLSVSKEVQQIEGDVKKVEGNPNQLLKGSEVGKDVSQIKTDAKELTSLEKQTTSYKNDLRKLKEGDSATVAGAEKNAENFSKKELQNTTQYNDISKETNNFQTPKNFIQQYDDMIASFKKQDLSQIKDFSSKKLPNPFIGQEAKLQAGMDQLNQLKKKYKNIPDSRYLPKFVPNEMKGRPLKEKLVPGISFQTYPGVRVGFDLSAYLMFRLTGKLRLGGGASDRLLYDGNNREIITGHIYSLRAMADFRFLPGTYLHGEDNWTYYGNGSVTPYQKATDPPLSGWTSRLNVGLMKTYKVSRRIDGQIQFLYNTLDWTNFPQTKNTTLRFGFEYKLGVRKTKAEQIQGK